MTRQLVERELTPEGPRRGGQACEVQRPDRADDRGLSGHRGRWPGGRDDLAEDLHRQRQRLAPATRTQIDDPHVRCSASSQRQNGGEKECFFHFSDTLWLRDQQLCGQLSGE